MKRIVFPAFALVIALVAPARNPAVSAGPPVHEVQVVAKKYTFEPATLEVTAGEAVRLVIHSDDTTHGFAIKKVKVNVVVPKGGQQVTAEFTAPPPGRYEIACSEFCGLGHHGMKATLVSTAPTPDGPSRD